jgi:hypothetical protein
MVTQTTSIPRIIHYCWFGRGKKPAKVVKCMKSWKRLLPDYELMEWNEDQFDIDSYVYTRQAYDARKYAFVSDVARLQALHEYGGIYLDTDVEVIKQLEPFLLHEAFSGFEDGVHVQSGTMGAVKGHPWIKQLLDDYTARRFIRQDGSMDTTTNTAVITRQGVHQGLQLNGQYQVLRNGVTFYPREYFSPYDYINGGSYLTDHSYTIHHFAKSWLPLHVRVRSDVKRVVSRWLGPGVISKMRMIVKR